MDILDQLHFDPDAYVSTQAAVPVETHLEPEVPQIAQNSSGRTLTDMGAHLSSLGSSTGELSEPALPQPEPSATYLQEIDSRGVEIGLQPRGLLVILDLNGVLLLKGNQYPQVRSKAKLRPHLPTLLKYLFRFHTIMVWASSEPSTVQSLCKQIFDQEQIRQLAGVWTRDQLRLPPDLRKKKLQVYKQLSWIWADEKIQQTCLKPSQKWDASNTVLIDDSALKACSEPYNLILVDTLTFEQTEPANLLLVQRLIDYMEELRVCTHVARYIKANPFQQLTTPSTAHASAPAEQATE